MFESLNNHASGVPALDAQADFRRARRAHAAARVARWLRRRGGGECPPALADEVTVSSAFPALEVVPLTCIVGTVEPSPHFDSGFRPASDVLRRRWERIALAHRRGDALPPVDLVQRGEGYYIVDGRHRVSVARSFGHPDIDAWVTGRGPCGKATA